MKCLPRSQGADPRIGLFMQMIGDLLVPKNFVGSLDFFTASFTPQRDDLGPMAGLWRQWARFRPRLCAENVQVVDSSGFQPNEMSFLGSVLYDKNAISAMRKSVAISLRPIAVRPPLSLQD